MKVYIAGRVTSLSREQAEINFARGANLMRLQNHHPVNPLDFVEQGTDPKEAMRLLLPFMLDCDAILMLMDWEFSEGAKIEYQLAVYAGLKILMEEDFD